MTTNTNTQTEQTVVNEELMNTVLAALQILQGHSEDTEQPQDLGHKMVQENEPSGSGLTREQEDVETANNPPMSELELVQNGVTYLNRYINKKSFVLSDIARIRLTYASDRDGAMHILPVVTFNSGIVATVYSKHVILFHDNWKNVLRIAFSKEGHPIMFQEPRQERRGIEKGEIS